MDTLTFKLIILFLPGIVSLFVIGQLTSIRGKDNYHLVTYALLLGFMSYVSFYYPFKILACVTSLDSDYKFVEMISKSKEPIAFIQVALCTVWSFILGVVLSVIINQKWFHKVFQWLKVTNTFADEDVWAYMMNSDDRKLEWIYLRDFENNKTYRGVIRAFSSNSKECELVLSNVTVFKDDTGDSLYEIPIVYLSRDVHKITIEYPKSA